MSVTAKLVIRFRTHNTHVAQHKKKGETLHPIKQRGSYTVVQRCFLFPALWFVCFFVFRCVVCILFGFASGSVAGVLLLWLCFRLAFWCALSLSPFQCSSLCPKP